MDIDVVETDAGAGDGAEAFAGVQKLGRDAALAAGDDRVDWPGSGGFHARGGLGRAGAEHFGACAEECLCGGVQRLQKKHAVLRGGVGHSRALSVW
jgi:hypothetical protein